MTTLYALIMGTGAPPTPVGVVNFNVDASKLASVINNMKVLKNGYSYVIESNVTTNIVISPNAPKGCIQGSSLAPEPPVFPPHKRGLASSDCNALPII